MKLIIDYEPTAKGVPRTKFVNGTVITYYHWKTTEALEAIRTLMKDMNLDPFPKHTPIKLTVTFYRRKSVWLPKKETMPFRKPDLDNMIKTILDCVSPILVPDDAQICTIHASKEWSNNSKGYMVITLEEDN